MAGKAMSNGCLLTKIGIFLRVGNFWEKGWKLAHPTAAGSTVKISLVLEIVGVFMKYLMRIIFSRGKVRLF